MGSSERGIILGEWTSDARQNTSRLTLGRLVLVLFLKVLWPPRQPSSRQSIDRHRVPLINDRPTILPFHRAQERLPSQLRRLSFSTPLTELRLPVFMVEDFWSVWTPLRSKTEEDGPPLIAFAGAEVHMTRHTDFRVGVVEDHWVDGGRSGLPRAEGTSFTAVNPLLMTCVRATNGDVQVVVPIFAENVWTFCNTVTDTGVHVDDVLGFVVSGFINLAGDDDDGHAGLFGEDLRVGDEVGGGNPDLAGEVVEE